MPPAPSESRMQAVVVAIQHYSPSFTEEIQGCSAAEISKLQTAVGRALPASYVEFLQCMGHRTGPLEFFPASDFSFQSVLRYHSNKKLPKAPERYLLFGLAEDDPYYDFYLDSDTPEPQVIRFPTPETAKEFPQVIGQAGWLASSLYEFVFLNAFSQFHLSRFPRRVMLAEAAGAPVTFEQAEAVLLKLGFTRHPQSSHAATYYERPAATVVCYRVMYSRMTVTLAAQDPKELARTADILEQQLHLFRP